jgi:hypothetical protein
MTSTEARKLAELLHAMATAVENSREPELKEFTRALNRYLNANRYPDKADKPRRGAVRQPQIMDLLAQLQTLRNREEAATILRRHKLTRRELLEMARSRSVHVAKEDNISRIEEKLVEAIVGSRLSSEAIRGRPTEDYRFAEINSRIVAKLDTQIFNEITNRRYRFVFNPETGRSKTLTFEINGKIGEGRNDNESSWRISEGRLEILNGHGEVYSRFSVLPDGKFQHTNDPDTKSIKGQYLEPGSS